MVVWAVFTNSWYHFKDRMWRWGWKRKTKKLPWNSTLKKQRPWHSVPSFCGKWSKSGSSDRCYFLGHHNHWGQWLQQWNSKTPAPWKGSDDKPKQHIKKQRHHFADKGPYGQSCGLSSSHVQMWELEPNEGWAAKNWCFQIVVLEKTLESLGLQGDQTIYPKGNQPWIFIGRIVAEAESSKTLKDWRQKEKRVAKDEMVR